MSDEQTFEEDLRDHLGRALIEATAMWHAAAQQCETYDDAMGLIHDSMMKASEELMERGADFGRAHRDGASTAELADRSKTMYALLRTLVAAGAALLPIYEKAMKAFENAPRIHRVN